MKKALPSTVQRSALAEQEHMGNYALWCYHQAMEKMVKELGVENISHREVPQTTLGKVHETVFVLKNGERHTCRLELTL